MSHPTISGKKFYEAYFGQLVGATIHGFTLSDDEDGFYTWPVFDVTLADGTQAAIEISSDEEGNSPGFIFGLPSPNQS